MTTRSDLILIAGLCLFGCASPVSAPPPPASSSQAWLACEVAHGEAEQACDRYRWDCSISANGNGIALGTCVRSAQVCRFHAKTQAAQCLTAKENEPRARWVTCLIGCERPAMEAEALSYEGRPQFADELIAERADCEAVCLP